MAASGVHRQFTFRHKQEQILRLGVTFVLLMNRHCGGIGCKSQELFCLRFKRRMKELLSRYHATAEAFGPSWEETL